MRKRDIYYVESVFGRQNHLRSLYNIALRGGGKSSMREGTRYNKSLTGSVLRYTGLGGQPSASTKPRVKVAAHARCKYTMKFGKLVPGPAYLHHFGKTVDTWAQPPLRGCRVLKKNGDEDFIYGKKQYLHHSIKDGYCCKSTPPPKSQAQQWIRNLGIPGLIEMAPTGNDLETYINLNTWWIRNLHRQIYIRNLMKQNREGLSTQDQPLYDQYRHMNKLASKIKAFDTSYGGMQDFAYKFGIGKEFDKELPDPRDDGSLYMRALEIIR